MRHWLFQRGRNESPNRKIFRAALIIGLALLVTKAGTTLKELVVAGWFGRGDALDAFLIAFLVPSFVLYVVVGSVGPALIPTYVATRQKRGDEAAQKLFAGVMLASVLVLTAVAILLGLLAPLYLPYLGSNFSAAKLLLTRDLLCVMLPFILFNGVLSCAAAVLNAGERFAAPAIAPLLTPLVTILLIETVGKRWGAFALAGGVLVGSIFEAALVISVLRAHGVRISMKWHGASPELRTVLSQYVPMLAATFLLGGINVVDHSMAAMLQPGSVSALGYANRIVSAITHIGVTALATAVLPYFSKMVISNDWGGCRHTLKRYSVLTVAASLPATLTLMIFARPLVRILFQRGAFNSADTQLVSWVAVCYAIQIPFFLWSALLIRLLSAMHRNTILMYCAGISLLLDIVLNLVLMRSMGIAGIALSTSLVFVFMSAFLGSWSLRLIAKQIIQRARMTHEGGVAMPS